MNVSHLTKTLLANSLALTTAILWVLCSVFVLVLSGFALSISRWWMHGLSLTSLGEFNLTAANFILGGVSLVVSAWIAGFVLGWSLEFLSKRK